VDLFECHAPQPSLEGFSLVVWEAAMVVYQNHQTNSIGSDMTTGEAFLYGAIAGAMVMTVLYLLLDMYDKRKQN